MRPLLLASALLLAVPASLRAEGPPLNPGDISWADAPPALPKGARIAVLAGDPAAAGLYVIRLALPAGYRVPAHHHPSAEYVTVLSGEFHLGMGDHIDEHAAATLRQGGFAAAPAGMNHFAWAATDTVVQIHGEGPFVITYANPAEDPRTSQ